MERATLWNIKGGSCYRPDDLHLQGSQVLTGHTCQPETKDLTERKMDFTALSRIFLPAFLSFSREGYADEFNYAESVSTEGTSKRKRES